MPYVTVTVKSKLSGDGTAAAHHMVSHPSSVLQFCVVVMCPPISSFSVLPLLKRHAIAYKGAHPATNLLPAPNLHDN